MVKNDFYSQGSRQQFKVQGQDLTIKHVPSDVGVKFPAFLDLFSDNFSSQWNAEDVYGRMDPIATFMNTRRSISVAWWVPADSFEQAEINLAKVNKLMTFLYPLYDGKSNGGATVINQGPLVRVSFGNLIRNANTGRGLLGYVNGFTFDPALEYGMFNRRVSNRKDGKDPQMNEYYPKTYRLNFELTVLHEHELGWRKTGTGYAFNGNKNDRVDEGSYPYYTKKADPDRVASSGGKSSSGGKTIKKQPVKSKQPATTKSSDEALPAAAPQPAGLSQPSVVRSEPNSPVAVMATGGGIGGSALIKFDGSI
jgi:hypothetical protein